MFDPGSHKKGVVDASTTSPPPATRCGRSTTHLIASWSSAPAGKNGGIVLAHRPAGSMIDPVPFLPGARLGEQPSLEPRQRHPEPVRAQQPHPPLKRPEYIAHRDFSAIECLPDDRCLRSTIPVDLPLEERHAGQRAGDVPEPIADTKKAA